jgi:hypothetical protein
MPLTGRWRIVEMDMWDRDAIDLLEPGFVGRRVAAAEHSGDPSAETDHRHLD